MSKTGPPSSKAVGGVEPNAILVQLWAKAPNWRKAEGIALAFGADPKKVIRWPTGGYGERERLVLPDIASHYLDLAFRAIDEGDLRRAPRPSEFVVWAESVGLAFHPTWKEALDLPTGAVGTWAQVEADRRAALVCWWAKAPFWTAEEAVCLSLNVSPDGDDDPALVRNPDKLRKDREQRLLLARRDQELKDEDTPENFLTWAESIGLAFHPAWKEAIVKQEPKQPVDAQPHDPAGQEPDLPIRERKSLLKLVIGMAMGGYGYDPRSKRNIATSDILADLERKGIGLGRDTVLKYLREGAELIDQNRLDE